MRRITTMAGDAVARVTAQGPVRWPSGWVSTPWPPVHMFHTPIRFGGSTYVGYGPHGAIAVPDAARAQQAAAEMVQAGTPETTVARWQAIAEATERPRTLSEQITAAMAEAWESR